MILNDPTVNPFLNLDVLGIAIKAIPLNNKSFQNHIAILYKLDGDNPKIFHLAGHKDLRNDDPDHSYTWLDLGSYFNSDDKEVLLACIMKVIAANPLDSIPYGFDIKGRLFDRETGEFKAATKEIGLTCATFIMEIFSSYGYDLVDISSWKNMDSKNISWQRDMILNMMKYRGVPIEWVNAQKGNIGNRRFLPEQVAASTQQKSLPTYPAIIKHDAKIIRKEIERRA